MTLFDVRFRTLVPLGGGVWICAQDVSGVERASVRTGKSRVHLVGGQSIEVPGAPDAVVAKLAKGAEEAGR